MAKVFEGHALVGNFDIKNPQVIIIQFSAIKWTFVPHWVEGTGLGRRTEVLVPHWAPPCRGPENQDTAPGALRYRLEARPSRPEAEGQRKLLDTSSCLLSLPWQAEEGRTLQTELPAKPQWPGRAKGGLRSPGFCT